jgi:hypothetical protein
MLALARETLLSGFGRVEEDAERIARSGGGPLPPDWPDEQSLDRLFALHNLCQATRNLLAVLMYHLFEQHEGGYKRQCRQIGVGSIDWRNQPASRLPSAATVNELLNVANTAKHGEDRRDPELRKLRPDLFIDPLLQNVSVYAGSAPVRAPFTGIGFYVQDHDLERYEAAVLALWEEIASAHEAGTEATNAVMPRRHMLEEHDRIFLRDFVNLTFKNHVMAVEALLSAGTEGPRFAASTLKRLSPELSEAEAEAQEAATNEAARFQRVMFAKIFAEFVAALEDFGALCFAIRSRARRGLLREFLASEVGDAASFFDTVLASPTMDLGEMLGLPPLASLKATLTDADYAVIERHYEEGAGFVRNMAAIYRDPPKEGVSPSLVPLRPDWQGCAHVLLDVAGDKKGAKGLFAWTFNKLKHRFMVLESVEEYAALPIASDFSVVSIETNGERAQLLVAATRDASRGAAEMAHVVAALDRHGALD